MPSINYKTALVTGGSKRIGAQLSRTLAKSGWAVVIHCHGSNQDAEELAHTIESDGGRAHTICGDLNDSESVVRQIEKASNILGPLGALINNASIFEPEQWHSVTGDSWDAHINVNLRAPFFLSQYFANALPADGYGAIINVIDQRVWNLRPDFVSYTVSKTGLWTLTQTLALALAPRIRVNGIGPGPTLANPRQSPETFAEQAQSMPLEHGATPNDIADAMMYLLNAEAVTGQMIAVDGGEHLGWAQASLARSIDE